MQVPRDHRKRQAGERLRVGPEWRGADDYMFSTAWGEPIHPDTVSSLMTTLIKTHNAQQSEPLPHARLHNLRHVHATTQFDAKIDWKALSHRIGHSDVAFTMKQYVQTDLVPRQATFARGVGRGGASRGDPSAGEPRASGSCRHAVTKAEALLEHAVPFGLRSSARLPPVRPGVAWVRRDDPGWYVRVVCRRHSGSGHTCYEVSGRKGS